MERTPQRRGNAAERRVADSEFAQTGAESLRTDLEEIDAKIGPLRARLRAGEAVDEELMPLLDKRSEIMRAIAGKETIQ